MQCYLTCANASHDDILLPNGQPVVVGRLVELNLTDPQCSRNQLQLTANYKNKYVLVKRLGVNSSQIDGIDIPKETSSKLLTDQNLYLVNMKYPHQIVFRHNPDSKSLLNNVSVQALHSHRSDLKLPLHSESNYDTSKRRKDDKDKVYSHAKHSKIESTQVHDVDSNSKHNSFKSNKIPVEQQTTEADVKVQEKGDDRVAVPQFPISATSKVWSQGLKAAIQDPDLVVMEDREVVVIKDKYPKAKFHWLVLPRQDISSTHQLTQEHVPLLKHILKMGKCIASDQMKKCSNLKFRYGYHAVASMSQLHMHVISQDFSSPALKTKKHWNSFTTDYFVDALDILSELESNGRVRRKNEYKALLDTPLRCHICRESQKNMPTLKRHIVECDKQLDRS